MNSNPIRRRCSRFGSVKFGFKHAAQTRRLFSALNPPNIRSSNRTHRTPNRTEPTKYRSEISAPCHTVRPMLPTYPSHYTTTVYCSTFLLYLLILTRACGQTIAQLALIDMSEGSPKARKHSCNACGKNFSTNSHLRRHEALRK